MKKHKKTPVSDIEKGDFEHAADDSPIGEIRLGDLTPPPPLGCRPIRVKSVRDCKKLIGAALLALQKPGADLDCCRGLIWGAGEFARLLETHEFETRLAAVEKLQSEEKNEYA